MPTTYYAGRDAIIQLVHNIKESFVAKESGKQLSTEDFTSSLKTKLESIATGAEVNALNNVQVNGTTLSKSEKTVNIDLTDGSTGIKVGKAKKIMASDDSHYYDYTAIDSIASDASTASAGYTALTGGTVAAAKATTASGLDDGANSDMTASWIRSQLNAVSAIAQGRCRTYVINNHADLYVSNNTPVTTLNALGGYDNITGVDIYEDGDINGQPRTLDARSLKVGDVLLAVSTTEPDWWVASVTPADTSNGTPAKISVLPLETTKVDLTPYRTQTSSDNEYLSKQTTGSQQMKGDLSFAIGKIVSTTNVNNSWCRLAGDELIITDSNDYAIEYKLGKIIHTKRAEQGDSNEANHIQQLLFPFSSTRTGMGRVGDTESSYTKTLATTDQIPDIAPASTSELSNWWDEAMGTNANS